MLRKRALGESQTDYGQWMYGGGATRETQPASHLPILLATCPSHPPFSQIPPTPLVQLSDWEDYHQRYVGQGLANDCDCFGDAEALPAVEMAPPLGTEHFNSGGDEALNWAPKPTVQRPTSLRMQPRQANAGLSLEDPIAMDCAFATTATTQAAAAGMVGLQQPRLVPLRS